MTISETKCFLELMNGMFSSVKMNEISVATWHELLKSYPADACRKGYFDFLRECTTTPKPADIRKLAGKYIEQKERTKVESVPCKVCEGTGLIRTVRKNESGGGRDYEYLYRCTCENAEHIDESVFPVLRSECSGIDEWQRVIIK